MNSRLIISLMAVSILCLFKDVNAQTIFVDLTTPLAIDPNVKIGNLENGLTYYIRKNKKPENRVELRLVVNAGSILENDDQLGLAHFTEHMAFNGTKTFPKNELIDFLQKTGVKFGADINAYTSFDETVYMIQLPTDDSSLVEKGFQVLEDWAHQVTFDGKEIDKERGVIIEEWRLGLGAQDRMMKKFLPVILKNSRYANRIPIGKVEVLEQFRHETLRDFYYDWYRPDLQAIIVVGDINPDLAEARIREHFADLTNPEQPRTRESYSLPDNDQPLIAITTDKEATQNVVVMFYKHPIKKVNTLGDFRETVMAELFTDLLNNRLNEISQQPSSAYVFANTSYGRFLTRTNDAYILTALCKENQIGNSLETLLAENERVRRFGFTQTELDRQKEELISQYEKEAKEFDKTESATLTGQYVSHFLSEDPIPGAQKRFKYLKNVLPGITLENIDSLARQYVTDKNMAMVIMAPDKEGVQVPDTNEIKKIIADSRQAELQPYVDRFREEPLVPAELSGCVVTDQHENDELGFTEYTLSNGVKVVVKSTAFKNDEILVSAFSLGGSSLYPDEQFLSANFAASVIDQSGAGSFDNITLEKKLKGKNLRITPYISEVKEGFTGNVSPKDMETLLELIYLYFNGPRKDTTAYKAFVSQLENQVKFVKASPIMIFYDTLFKTAFPDDKRLIIIPTPEQIRKINLDEVYQIYTDRFADASDFTFFLVGNFEVDSIMPMILKYLGNLPSISRKESYRNVMPEFSKEVVNTTVFKGTDPQSMVGMVFSDRFDWTPQNNMYLSMLREWLSIRLLEVIREKLSGVYSPQVMLQTEQFPEANFYFGIMFGCSPKTTDKLTKAVFSEIKRIRKKGPVETDLGKVKETLIRTRETDLEKNGFWLARIESVYFNHDDPGLVKTFRDRVNAVTVQDMKEAANRYLNPERYIRVVLMPEKK